jgi:hypothetical protein
LGEDVSAGEQACDEGGEEAEGHREPPDRPSERVTQLPRPRTPRTSSKWPELESETNRAGPPFVGGLAGQRASVSHPPRAFASWRVRAGRGTVTAMAPCRCVGDAVRRVGRWVL